MTTWSKAHFASPEEARNTLARIAAVGALVGLVLVVIGVLGR